MKQKILLLSLSAGMAILFFSSYSAGPFASAGNRTGSAGSPANCTGAGCHAANSAATTVGIVLTTMANVPVTSYTPGVTYKVAIGGTNTSALPKFGFQASSVRAAATSTQAGSFASTSSNVSVRGTTFQIVEHNTPINATSGAYAITFNWTAPPKGTGTVRFFAMLNAVNATGTEANDAPNAAPTLDITEGPAAGVGNVEIARIEVYPNPASSLLNMKLDVANGKVCHMRIFDIGGREVSQSEAVVNNGLVSADISGLRTGNYFVSLEQAGNKSYASFLKH